MELQLSFVLSLYYKSWAAEIAQWTGAHALQAGFACQAQPLALHSPLSIKLEAATEYHQIDTQPPFPNHYNGPKV